MAAAGAVAMVAVIRVAPPMTTVSLMDFWSFSFWETSAKPDRIGQRGRSINTGTTCGHIYAPDAQERQG